MNLRAAIFDVDGVVTDTASVHFAAWRALFDGFLAGRGQKPPAPFTTEDYHLHVDGRPRAEGIETFLASRGITLPRGEPSDPADAPTVHGLGRKKDEAFRSALSAGVRVFGSTVTFALALRARGVRIGAASSSRNCRFVLSSAGLGDLFEARIDGETSVQLGLRGKPAPDIFLACARALSTPPRDCLVVEDAVAGVQAARVGGFGLVVGIDREGTGRLAQHGAHVVVADLADLDLERALFEVTA